MKSYRYAHLQYSTSGVSLSSTDPQVLDWILAELKKVIPDYRVAGKSEDGFSIDKLQYGDHEAGWWILKQLCLQGWKPFAVHEDTFHNYHFRLECNAK
jgi:hypothetical protein